MKSILTILFSFLFIVSGFSQTRNVVVDTNGVVVQPTNIWTANATNARSGLGLSSTNDVSFNRVQVGNSLVATNGFSGNVLIGGSQSISFVSGGNPATTRTNLGLGATWLTNTNVTNFRSAIGLGSTNDVTLRGLTVDSGDQAFLNANKLEFSFGLFIEAEEQRFVESGNDIFQWATDFITFYVPVGFGSSAIVSETRTNLGLSATWLTNTNVTNFRTAIGLGSTNDVTFANINVGEIRSTLIIGSPPNSLATNLGIDVDDAVLKNAIYGAGGVGIDWGGTNLIAGLPLSFVTNTHASITRTNLGLGAMWLTNTNVTNFRTAIGLGATNSVRFGSILLYQDGEAINSITYSADTLSFSQNGVTFFSLDTASGGTVTFEKPISFLGINAITNAAITRSNLGLGASWLTNTNAANFRTNIGLGLAALTNTNTSNFRSDIGIGWSALTNSNAGTSLVSVNTNGEVVSPTNFWQAAPINTRVQLSQPVVNATNAATNARNLYLYSLAISTTGVTNTITLPTNSLVFLGDVATVIHDGPTSSVTEIRQIGSATNLISLNQVREAVKFIYESDGWRLADNISYVEPIQFSGTNAAANAAASVTNLFTPNIPLSYNKTNYSIVYTGESALVWTSSLGVIFSNEIVFRDAQGNTAAVSGTGITFGSTNTNPTAVVFGFEDAGGEVLRGIARTNLGLVLSALTNTNNATFQEAIFTTNTAPTNAGTFNDHVAWMGVSIVTNGVTNVFKIPLYK